MNRTIWIFRAIALLVLLIFTFLMWNLHANLVEIRSQQQSGPPQVTEPAHDDAENAE